jgi:hypothetical protein
VSAGFDHVADVGGQLRVGLLHPASSAGREVLDASDPGGQLVQAGRDGVACPSEPSLGTTGTAAAESESDFGLEKAPRVPGQALGGSLEEVVGGFG